MNPSSSLNAKQHGSKAERTLFVTIFVVLIVAVIAGFWYEHISAPPPTVVIPTPVMPAHNAYDAFVAAANAEVQNNAVDNAESSITLPGPNGKIAPPPTLAQKAALIQANAHALGLLRQGLNRPYQSPPVRSYAMNTFPDYAKFRALARLLALEGQVKAAQGNWNDAAQANLDAVDIGMKIQHGSGILGSLVGIACEAIGRYPLWSEVDHLSSTQAEAASRRLAKIEAQQVPFASIVQQEKWTGQASLLQILRAPNWHEALVKDYFTPNGNGFSGAQTAKMLFVSRRQIFEDYTRFMDHELTDARLPYADAPSVSPHTGDPISEMTVLDYHPFRVKVEYTNAENQLLVMALALRAYHADHGAYPANLISLIPKYLSRVPIDPYACTGPLRYRLLSGRYVFYSDGPDGKDDGGKPIFDASKPKPQHGEHDARYYVQDGSTGDLVAGVNK